MAKKAKPKPKSKRTYDTPLQIRVDAELLVLIKKAAEADRRTVSDWARIRLGVAAKGELEEWTP